MSALTWDTFERYRQKGVDARRAGRWDVARIYLLEAARLMAQLARDAQGDELRDARQQTAQRLLELARDCEAAGRQKRPAPVPAAYRAQPQAAESQTPATDAQQWLVKEKPTLRFADVAGLEEVKQSIRLKMVYPFEHPELAQKFDIKPGGGVLLYGPSGTGKTMLARAVAGELEAAFFSISPADVLSKWVGEAEQNVKNLFDAALAEPRAVIFIDEIEALLPARRDEGSSVMQRLVPQLLGAMDGFDKKGPAPLLLGATNVPWQLDPAALRPGRFDEKVYVSLPDLPARRMMLQMYLAHRPLADDVNLDDLAAQLEGYSGADIRYICDRSATIPFLESVASGADGQITAQIIAHTLAATPRSVTAEALARFEAWTAQAATIR